MFQYFNSLKRSKYILEMLVFRDIFSKYKKSILGVAWSMITPISMVGVIGLVYSIVFGIPLITFVPYLFSGLTPWFFISGAIDSGTSSYIIAEGFITQTKIDTEIFPLRMVLGAFINYLFMSVAYFLVYALIKPDAFNINVIIYSRFYCNFYFLLGCVKYSFFNKLVYKRLRTFTINIITSFILHNSCNIST